MLGIPVLSRGAAVLGAVPVGWGMGSCRRHISQSNKNSSSNAQWGFSCGIFTRNHGFHQWHCGEGFSPLPKFRAQDCAGASPTSSLHCWQHPMDPPSPCPASHPTGDAHPNLTLPSHHPSPGIFAEPLQNQWSRAELGACGPLLAASLGRVLEQLSPNMEGFFCLRFSARRPRPKSAAFQMLRSARLFFPPPAPSQLPPSGLGPAPTGTGVIPPPQLTGIPGSPISILCGWHKPDPASHATPKAMVIRIWGDKEAREKDT